MANADDVRKQLADTVGRLQDAQRRGDWSAILKLSQQANSLQGQLPAASQSDTIGQITDFAKGNKAADQATLDKAFGQAFPILQGAGNAADASESAIAGKLASDYADLNSDPTAKYVGNVANYGGNSQADAGSIAAQNIALSKLNGLTDPTISGPEKLMMEQARRQEEQGLKANRDAVLENLAARGVAGSGAEVGAMLGAQQTQSANRQMQDLGAQANAVNRAQTALGMYGNLASGMRSQSFNEAANRNASLDATAQFNNASRSAYNQFYQRTAGERAKDVASTSAGVAADKYTHSANDANAITNNAKMKVGAAQGDNPAVTSALTTSLGQQNMNDAIAALKGQGSGLLGGKFVPGIL